MTTSAHTKLDLTGLQAHFKHQTPVPPPAVKSHPAVRQPEAPAQRVAYIYEFRDSMPRVDRVSVLDSELTSGSSNIKVKDVVGEFKVHTSCVFLTAEECVSHAKLKAAMHYCGMLDRIDKDAERLT